MPTEPTTLSLVAPTVSAASIDVGTRDRSPRPSAQNVPDLRLVIEQGPQRGTFVYKTVDRTTGEILRQFPREELVRMKEDPAYAAGAVTDTTA